MAMVEVLAHPQALAPLIAGALKPVRGPALVDLLVASHDADDAQPSIKALAVVNASLGTHVPLLLPAPEIQAWLTRKRAIERAYEREHCTVPEPDEEKLRQDAKAELQRLLRTFGGKFNAQRQARLAEHVSLEDLERYDWTGWKQVPERLEEALEHVRAQQK